jgi:hypothetical protein
MSEQVGLKQATTQSGTDPKHSPPAAAYEPSSEQTSTRWDVSRPLPLAVDLALFLDVLTDYVRLTFPCILAVFGVVLDVTHGRLSGTLSYETPLRTVAIVSGLLHIPMFFFSWVGRRAVRKGQKRGRALVTAASANTLIWIAAMWAMIQSDGNPGTNTFTISLLLTLIPASLLWTPPAKRFFSEAALRGSGSPLERA